MNDTRAHGFTSFKKARIWLLIASTGLSGCAFLYHPEQDKQAQAAAKAIADSQVAQSLTAERKSVLAAAERKQASVKRLQLALRDQRLSYYIDGESRDTWKLFVDDTRNRFNLLIGASRTEEADDSEKARLQFGRHLETAQIAVDGNARLLESTQADFNAYSPKTPFVCLADGTARKPDGLLRGGANLFANAQDACKSYREAQKDFTEAFGSGLLASSHQQIAELEAEQLRIQQETQTAKEDYKKALAEVEAANDSDAPDGALKAAADNLSSKLGQFDAITLKFNDAAKYPVIEHLADTAQIEKLQQKKQELEKILGLLGGTAPESGEPVSHERLYRLANLVNAATKAPATTASDLVLQAELLRLQVQAAEQRVANAKAQVTLLKKRFAAQMSETLYLYQALDRIHAVGSRCPFERLFERYEDSRCKSQVGSALLAYSNAYTLGRTEAELIDYQIMAQTELAALDQADNALAQYDSIMRASTQLLVKYYGGGLRSEDLANIIQALGLGSIAHNVQ